MSTAPAAQVVLVVRGHRDAARAAVEEFFVGRGWRPRERDVGRIDYERGSRRRTVLLGALAGPRFFLTAQIELREADAATEVRYRWGVDAGLALGGTLGRRRADRVHEQTAAALEQHLQASGRLLRTRRR